MTIEVIEQERKKEVAAGAGVLLLLILLAFALAKKKEEEPIKGQPIITVEKLGFEGSPQTAKITKKQGESFTAVVGINNTGGTGSVPFELGIGDYAFFIRNDKGNSPWIATLFCPQGSSTVRITGRLSSDFPARPDKPYDAWVIAQGKTYDSPDCFTVVTVAAAISILSLAWL